MGSLTPLPIDITLTIYLDSALHIGTGLGLSQILDDRTVQGPHPVLGVPVPYIPGSSLKGRLRFQARQLSAYLGWNIQRRSQAEAHLFGFADQPGSLIFDDAHLDLQALNWDAASYQAIPMEQRSVLLSTLTRHERSFVSLSQQRRVALDERLFRLELVDAQIAFQARVWGTLPTAGNPQQELALLLAAARDLTHLGGHKGRGLGACRVQIAALTLGDTQPSWQSLLEQLR